MTTRKFHLIARRKAAERRQKYRLATMRLLMAFDGAFQHGIRHQN